MSNISMDMIVRGNAIFTHFHGAMVENYVAQQLIEKFRFGSRVSGRHSSSADADIGLLADEKLPANLYHKIRNAIDESIIPWEVDIIDFTRADQTFKEETLITNSN
jgi:hypothetical protein